MGALPNHQLVCLAGSLSMAELLLTGDACQAIQLLCALLSMLGQYAIRNATS